MAAVERAVKALRINVCSNGMGVDNHLSSTELIIISGGILNVGDGSCDGEIKLIRVGKSTAKKLRAN